MLFNSFIFFIFLGVVLPVYYFIPRNTKKVWLLMASYVFYEYWKVTQKYGHWNLKGHSEVANQLTDIIYKKELTKRK